MSVTAEPMTSVPASLSEHEARELFARYGIPTAGTALCTSTPDVASYLGSTTASSHVLKVCVDGLTHKSAVNGVRVDVPTDDVLETFTELVEVARGLDGQHGALRGILVEEFLGSGPEVVVGFHVDPGLGAVVMLGDGGSEVETSRRVTFGRAPIDQQGVAQLVRDWRDLSQVAHLLPDAAKRQLEEILLAVAGPEGLALRENVVSMDINPFILTGNGLIAVDGVISRQTEPAPTTCGQPRLAGDLSAFLDPGSLAVVGASTDPDKPGYQLLRNIVEFGFDGDLYPVHPQAEQILGYPVYPSVADIPGAVDKVIVLVGRQHVPSVLAQCAEKGVPAVQVYSSGFSEYDEEDTTDLETRVIAAIEGSRTRVMGPNCWGAYSPRSRLTTNAPRFSGKESGNVAFVSQSGTHFVDVVRRSHLRSLPLYGAVSVGNCLDLQVHEIAQHLLAQDDVDVLGLYLEGTRGARDLLEVLHRSEKPVVLMRGGRTEQGGRAATSHTAALIGDDAVWSALFEQAGAIIVDTIEDMMDTLSALTTLVTVSGNRLTVVGTGGGVAVAAADFGARNGLLLSEFPAEVGTVLADRFGQPGTSMKNPVDVTVWNIFPEGRSALSEILSIIAVPEVADSAIAYLEYGSILDLNSPERAEELVHLLIEDLETNGVLIPTSFVLRTGGEPSSEEMLRLMERCLRPHGIAVFSRIQDAVLAHARLAAAANARVETGRSDRATTIE